MSVINHYKNVVYYIAGIITIACVAYTIQINMFFNPDVASLLYDTKLFLSGGTYVKDFFETNPPMIFILYSPVVLLQQWFLCDIRHILNGYVIFLALLSLYLCYQSLNSILENKNDLLKYAILCSLIYGYLILPIYDFGQREHLLLLLIMPYVFYVIFRAQNKSINYNILFAILIGLMAGIGFSLKPFFLIPLVLIELYLIVKTRNPWAWVRVEAWIVLAIMLFYLVLIRVFHPAYLETMLPLISHWYFLGTKEDWPVILSRPKVLFCFAILIYYFAFYRKTSSHEFIQVLMLALFGFVLAFLIPRSAWNYHVLPAYVFAIVLCVIFFCQGCLIYQNEKSNKKLFFLMTIASFMMPMIIHALELDRAIKAVQYKSMIMLFNKIKTLPFHSIYCYSTVTSVCFPMVTLNNLSLAGRFPLLWWVRGMTVVEDSAEDMPVKSYLVKEKNYFSSEIAYDLNHFKPELIVIFALEEQFFLPKGYSFSSYFSDNPAYREAWSHYRLLEEMGYFRLYYRFS